MNDGYVWDEIRGGKKEKTRKIKGNIRKKTGLRSSIKVLLSD